MFNNCNVLGIMCLYVVPSIYLFFKNLEKEKHDKEVHRMFTEKNGGKIMFNSKEMKTVKFNQIRSYMVKGIPVYMVMLDNTIVEVTDATDIELLFFHYLRNGAFAVPRKKWNGLGDFTKHLNLGQWSFEVSHKRKEVDA